LIWRKRFEYSIGLLILFGFWVRLSFLQANIYHIDEFISMLAVQMVAEKGLPIFPSGHFYDHGLLFSLLTGGLVAGVGFMEEIVRWPSLLASVATIAVYYMTGKHLFNSRTAGLLAATLFTLDDLSIVWGGRARMYAQAHLFILLSIFWFIYSTLIHPNPRNRYTFLAVLSIALLSHTVGFLILPPLAILLVMFTLAYRRDWLHQPGLWKQAIVAFILLTAIFATVIIGQSGGTTTGQTPSPEPVEVILPENLGFLQRFVAPGLSWNRFDNLVYYYQSDIYGWLLFAIGLTLLITLYRFWHKSYNRADISFLFLALFCLLVILEQGSLFDQNWQKTRYLFVIVTPAFFLLGAASITRLLEDSIGRIMKSSIDTTSALLTTAIPLIGVVLIIMMWGPEAWHTANSQSTGGYNTAFNFVVDNWQEGDKVMTVHPSAAYVYVGQTDYYASQSSTRIIQNDEDDTPPVDRYIGSPLVDTVERLNTVLATGNRIWFVIDQKRLFNQFEPFFVQQIFAQMEFVREFGGVYIFVSRAIPMPIPAEPTSRLAVDFGDVIQLGGYAVVPAPDSTVKLILYWRPRNLPAQPFKLFVQLRDEQGQTVAQADHFIFTGLLTSDSWYEIQEQNEWLRDTAQLSMPSENGPYQIYVGLYHPDTYERTPVINDASGENAAIISLPVK
jgi:hypothetical protein